jgi:hypothetical protein
MPEEESAPGKEDPGVPSDLPSFAPDLDLIGYIERGQWPLSEQREAADQAEAVPLPLPEDEQSESAGGIGNDN